MEESFALAIHKALHNWRDVEGEVDLLGDGEIVSFSTAPNGCRVAVWRGHRLMEQNKSKSTSWAVKAKKGARITWVLSAPRWGLIQDDAIVRGCSAIKGSKPSTKADSSDDDEEEEDKADAKTNESEDEDEEEEEEFDMSNKITELRAFTKKHGIKVVGRKKEDVLNAITKWQKQRKLEREARKAKAVEPQEDEEASEDENAEQDEEELEERAKTPIKSPARPAKSKAGLTERKAEEMEAAPEAPATPEKEEDAAVSEPVEVVETPVGEERAEKISGESEQNKGEIDTDLDLDLDNLDSYDFKTLKAYCEAEALELPTGARKQDYITAIRDYNADFLNEADNPEPNQVVGAAPLAEPKQDEDEEDLYLDQLDRYPIATLKKYCTDERIAVAGTTKEAYMEAIIDYNDSERSWLEVSRADDDGESPLQETKTSDKEEAKRDGEKKASVECDVEEETEETEIAMWKRKAAKWKQRARELQRLNELQTKSPHRQMRRTSGSNKENASPTQVAKTGVRA